MVFHVINVHNISVNMGNAHSVVIFHYCSIANNIRTIQQATLFHYCSIASNTSNNPTGYTLLFYDVDYVAVTIETLLEPNVGPLTSDFSYALTF